MHRLHHISFAFGVRPCSSRVARWACSCGFQNLDFRTTCFRCEAGRQGSDGSSERDYVKECKCFVTPPQTAPFHAPNTFKRGDWMCLCGTHNFARRSVCVSCGKAQPNKAVSPSMQVKPDDWKCQKCSFHNFGSRKICFKCSAENGNQTSASGV